MCECSLMRITREELDDLAARAGLEIRERDGGLQV